MMDVNGAIRKAQRVRRLNFWIVADQLVGRGDRAVGLVRDTDSRQVTPCPRLAVRVPEHPASRGKCLLPVPSFAAVLRFHPAASFGRFVRNAYTFPHR